jgi:hypothetical protein
MAAEGNDKGRKTCLRLREIDANINKNERQWVA